MSDPITMPRLVVAGIGSDSGKTTVALGLVSALRHRGRTVQAFKAGSDFIDSAYLAHASGRPCRTLDSWVLAPEGVTAAFAHGMRGADCAIVEGVGGLFDGHGLVTGPRNGRSRFPGSTAEIAQLINSPIVLVLDVGVMGETAAAVSLGIRQLDPSLNIIGVILNNSDNARRRGAVEDAVWELATLPVLGTVPRTDALHIPHSHHSLQALTQNPGIDAALDEIGALVARHCNLDLIERLMAAAEPVIAAPRPAITASQHPARIGVAFDDAFCYYYPENIELLEEAGAEIVPLSPLDDHALPRDLDAVYLGGGIIEAFIPQLALNRAFMDSLRRLHQHGVPIYAECGGALYIARSLETHDGVEHAMAGLVDADLSVRGERGRDRYREVIMAEDSLLGTRGTRLRGHEFHVTEHRGGGESHGHAYSAHDCDGEPLGCEGWAGQNLVASLVHLHFGQDPDLAPRFVAVAQAAAQRRHLQSV